MDIPNSDDRDSALISQILSGDRESYKFLYDANVESLFRFLKQFVKSDSAVQELVQRAFIKAYEGLVSFNHRSKFTTWPFQIALNEMRGDARRNSIIQFVDIEEASNSIGNNDDEISLEWNSTLRTLFDRLDDTKRAVFILYEVEGYSHSEISQLLDLGESTSRTILTRTKQLLRKQIISARRIP